MESTHRADVCAPEPHTCGKMQLREQLSTIVSPRLIDTSPVPATTTIIFKAWAQQYLKELFIYIKLAKSPALAQTHAKSFVRRVVSIKHHHHCHHILTYVEYVGLVTPGPGAYVAPSAFGVYVGEKALLAQQEANNSAKAKSVIKLYNNGYEDVKTMINNTF